MALRLVQLLERGLLQVFKWLILWSSIARKEDKLVFEKVDYANLLGGY